MVSVIAVKRKCQSIRLVELITTVMRLWFNIYSDNIKASTLIAFGCATSSTE